MELLSLINDIEFENIIKIFISVALGFLIGIERELTNKSAGLRTHILVCLGSTVFTILSFSGFTNVVAVEGIRIMSDPARIASQILTGIGFIGGGAVLHYGISVYGLTTAATLWITASIGMAVGAGLLTVAVVTTVSSLLVLILIRNFENIYLSKHVYKGARLKVTAICNHDTAGRIQDLIYREFNSIIHMKQERNDEHNSLVNLTLILDIFAKEPFNKIQEKLKKFTDIESLTIQHILNER